MEMAYQETKMKLAYIIGPLTASSIHNRILNIRKAEELSIALWSAGYAVICPHLNSGLLQGACHEQDFIDGYIEILKRCDFAVVSSEQAHNKNSIIETEYCIDNNIPVYPADMCIIIQNEGR